MKKLDVYGALHTFWRLIKQARRTIADYLIA
jgi:predicted DNA-binding protein (UPF0251 family)